MRGRLAFCTYLVTAILCDVGEMRHLDVNTTVAVSVPGDEREESSTTGISYKAPTIGAGIKTLSASNGASFHNPIDVRNGGEGSSAGRRLPPLLTALRDGGYAYT